MTSLKFCMLAITGVTAIMIVKQWRSDFLPLLRLAMTLILAMAIAGSASPLIEYLFELTKETPTATYATVLFKALGIAVLTQCCADLCRECGESGTATGVELIGKTELLLLSLPLVNDVLQSAQRLLALGS